LTADCAALRCRVDKRGPSGNFREEWAGWSSWWRC
jgi:hypothetical protein